jgi:hypothetical protein
MAFEMRSIVWEQGGKFHLVVIPSTAPSSTKTITRANLAGKGSSFACGYTSRESVRNALTIRHSPTSGEAIRGNLKPWAGSFTPGAWEGTIKLENVLSGYSRQPETIDLGFVRSASLAASVGAILLKQRERIYKTISFPVFWDSTDITLGDTITMSGQGFWEGVKFFVNSVRRTGINRATYTAVEWW